MKKIFSVFSVILLMFVAQVTAFAAETPTDLTGNYLVENGNLSLEIKNTTTQTMTAIEIAGKDATKIKGESTIAELKPHESVKISLGAYSESGKPGEGTTASSEPKEAGKPTTPTKKTSKKKGLIPKLGSRENMLVMALGVVVLALALFAYWKNKTRGQHFIVIFVALSFLFGSQTVQAASVKKTVEFASEKYATALTVTYQIDDNGEEIEPQNEAVFGSIVSPGDVTEITITQGETSNKVAVANNEFNTHLLTGTYTITGEGLSATLVVKPQGESTLENHQGEISLGKSLRVEGAAVNYYTNVLVLAEVDKTENDLVSGSLTVTQDLPQGFDVLVGDKVVLPLNNGYGTLVPMIVTSVSTEGTTTIGLRLAEETEMGDIIKTLKLTNLDDLVQINYVDGEPVQTPSLFRTAAMARAPQKGKGLTVSAKVDKKKFPDNKYVEMFDGSNVNVNLNLDVVEESEINFRYPAESKLMLDLQTKAKLDLKIEHKTADLLKLDDIVLLNEDQLGSLNIYFPQIFSYFFVNPSVILAGQVNGKMAFQVSPSTTMHNTFGYNGSAGFTHDFDIKYDFGVDKFFDDFNESFSLDAEYGIKFKGEVGLGAGAPILKALHYFSTSLEAGPKLSANAFVNPTLDINATLKASLEAVIKAKFLIFEAKMTPVSYDLYTLKTEEITFGEIDYEALKRGEEVELPLYTKNASGSSEAITDIANLNFSTLHGSGITFDTSGSVVKMKLNQPRLDNFKVSVSKRTLGVIAQYYGEKEFSLAAGTVTGTIKEADQGKVVQDVKIEAVQADQNKAEKTVYTANDGKYNLALKPGEYVFKATHKDYYPVETTITVTEGNQVYDEELYLLGKDMQGEGTASGTITDAQTTNSIADATLTFYKNRNNLSGEPVGTTTTNADGTYAIKLPAGNGNYTMKVEKEGFTTTNRNIRIYPGREINKQDLNLSRGDLTLDQLRVVLEWPRPTWALDLDTHWTVTDADGATKGHVYFRNQTLADQFSAAQLDWDNRTGGKPETLTVSKMSNDLEYTYSVYRYGGSPEIKDSRAVVRVYAGDTELGRFNAPSVEGETWKVFKVVNGKLVILNEMVGASSYRLFRSAMSELDRTGWNDPKESSEPATSTEATADTSTTMTTTSSETVTP